MRNKTDTYAGLAGYPLITAMVAIAAAWLLGGCAAPAMNSAFKATPKRVEPAKAAKPATTAPAAAPKPQIKRPASIGFNAMRHFNNAMKAAEKSPAEALISFNKAIDSEPYFTEARYNLGVMMFRADNNAGARAEFEKAAETGFALGRVYSTLGLLYIGEKNYSKAAEAMLKAAAEEPGNARMLVNLASLRSLQGNTAIADKTYAEAEAKDPDDPYLNYNIGIRHMEAKEYGKAALRFKKAFTLKAPVPEAALAYAEALFEMEEYGEAEKAYLEAASLYPKLAAPHINLGILYELYLNDYKKAEESYLKYLELGGGRASEVRQWIDILKEKNKQ